MPPKGIAMCPCCAEPLVSFELGGVEIDRCVTCGGTWLDPGELEQITEQAGLAPGNLSRALSQANDGRASRRRCPRCGRKLHPVKVGDSHPVELDRCLKGHGLWFDRGEMEKVIGLFDEGQAGAVGRFFADLTRHERQTHDPHGQEGQKGT